MVVPNRFPAMARVLIADLPAASRAWLLEESRLPSQQRDPSAAGGEHFFRLYKRGVVADVLLALVGLVASAVFLYRQLITDFPEHPAILQVLMVGGGALALGTFTFWACREALLGLWAPHRRMYAIHQQCLLEVGYEYVEVTPLAGLLSVVLKSYKGFRPSDLILNYADREVVIKMMGLGGWHKLKDLGDAILEAKSVLGIRPWLPPFLSKERLPNRPPLPRSALLGYGIVAAVSILLTGVRCYHTDSFLNRNPPPEAMIEDPAVSP